MTAAPIPPGKLPVELLARLLGELGPPPPEVRLGPAVGEDACVIDVPAGALVVATDPITLTSGEVGRYAVTVNANDVAVTGVRPRWFLAAVLLPVGTAEAAVEALFAELRAALAEIGAVLVGGHTEVTPAVSQPVVVGQMLGLASDGRYVTTSGARPGDVLVQVGPVPVEGAAVLAVEAADRLGGLDRAVVAAAAAGLDDPGISVVEAALAAADLGATALHDPTEGGLASGLHELAEASGVALRVDPEAVAWFEPGVAVCRAIGADPWATLASGSVVATFPPGAAEQAVAELAERGHRAVRLGAVENGEGVSPAERVRTTGCDPLARPARDELARLLV